jgi:hypothetical protein
VNFDLTNIIYTEVISVLLSGVNHLLLVEYVHVSLISTFRRVLYVVCFLLGNSPASGVYMPTFRNTVPSS